jgi:DNA-binding NarL/FixJ family response regulator
MIMITVLVADDHTVLRDGLRYLLEAQGDIQVVGMAANGQEAVEQALLYCPDVVVMDISMPVMNGIDATKLICQSCKDTKVVVLSMHHTAEYMQRAMEAGANGYLLKDSAGRELVTAIRQLKEGKSYFAQK